MRPKPPTTEAEYLAEFGYAPDSAVGKLGWQIYSAPSDAARVDLLGMIGWTVPKNRKEDEALAAFQSGLEQLAGRRAAA